MTAEEIRDCFYKEYEFEEQKYTLITDDLIKKSQEFNDLGFTNNKYSVKLQQYKDHNKSVKKYNLDQRHLQNKINYFKEKYPNYTFISGHDLYRLCQDNRLFYDSINLYNGNITDDLIKNVKNNLVKDFDKTICLKLRTINDYKYPSDRSISYSRYIGNIQSLKDLGYSVEIKDFNNSAPIFKEYQSLDVFEYLEYHPMSLSIVGPVKLFNTFNYTMFKNKNTLKSSLFDNAKKYNKIGFEPLLLQPVYYDCKYCECEQYSTDYLIIN